MPVMLKELVKVHAMKSFNSGKIVNLPKEEKENVFIVDQSYKKIEGKSRKSSKSNTQAIPL